MGGGMVLFCAILFIAVVESATAISAHDVLRQDNDRLWAAQTAAKVSSTERCLNLSQGVSRTPEGGRIVNYDVVESFARKKDPSAGFACESCWADNFRSSVNIVPPPTFECSSSQQLEWKDIVIVLEVSHSDSLSSRLTSQLGDRGCSPLFCVGGVWWNSTAFRDAKILLVEYEHSSSASAGWTSSVA